MHFQGFRAKTYSFRVQNLHFSRVGVTTGPNPGPRAFEARLKQFGAFQLAMRFYFYNHWEGALLAQILARSLLEPDVGNLGLAGWLLKFICRTIGNGPFWAKSWPGAFWSEIFVFDLEAMTGLKHTKQRDAALSGTKKGCISSNE